MENNMDKDLVKEEVVVNKVKKNKKKDTNNTGIILVVSILLSFVCGAVGAYLIVSNFSVQSVVKNITTSELVETSISVSVDKVYSSTVIVVAYKDGKQISTGTGFVYKKDGNKAYIMTNNHVIDSADTVEVEFNDKSERIDAKILGGEVYSDIAVLTIDAKEASQVVETGNSDEIKLGDTIFTVGSPMGVTYKGTVTKGILSGKDRMVEVNLTGNTTDYYMKVLQLDAAVNPGNSGGPLCDVSGKVIGIISLKIVQDEVEGMGFAIPIEDALEYASAIEEGGEVVRPYLGVGMLDLSEEYYLWQNRITIPDGIDEGVAIIEVVEGSPADKAGLKKGDIVIKIGAEDISGLAEFRYELFRYNVGDKVTMVYYRGGVEKTATITLGKSE
ncbi:MAG: trypsin-like peptidase domain-containing protein [Bacilli bacterium]|nr:trypsin-like peptidase domain-containing protein [Bacilli bacterium]